MSILRPIPVHGHLLSNRRKRNPACKPGPSATFGKFDGMGGHALITELMETNAIIGAVFSLLHPDSFNRQLNAHGRIYNKKCGTSDKQRTAEAYDLWTSPFNGIAMLCNRETPFHRDLSGSPLMFDFLSTFGVYEDGRFDIPLLRRSIRRFCRQATSYWRTWLVHKSQQQPVCLLTNLSKPQPLPLWERKDSSLLCYSWPWFFLSRPLPFWG